MNTAQLNQTECKLQDFYALLKREYETYMKIFYLCEEDRKLIECGEIQQLRKSIGEKQSLLNEILNIEKEIYVLKEEWNKIKDDLPESSKGDIVLLINNFKDLMEKIVSSQKENEKLLSERNSHHINELSTIRRGKNLSKAYSVYGNSIPHSRFMDKSK